MKKKFQQRKAESFLIESNAVFLHEFDGKAYSFTADPAEAWAFTAESVKFRQDHVKRSHPQAKVVLRSEAIRQHNLRTVGQSHGTGQ